MAEADLKIIATMEDRASKALDRLADSTQKTRSRMGGLVDMAAKVGFGIFGITQIAGAAGNIFGGLISDAVEAEKTTAALNAVLASTKGIAGVTAEAAQDLANSLSKVAPFEDEAILSAENMLLTFTSIGKDIFPQATETVLNMSQALGQDLKSSAIQLGKALNDPIEGATALRRVGVALTDAQEKQIKAFMASNDIMSAQKVILGELETEFGGAARAAGTTFAGQMKILQTQIGNVKEAIGGPLIGAISGLMSSIMPLVTRLAEDLPGAIEGLKERASDLIKKFEGLAEAMDPVLSKFKDFLKSHPGPILAATAAVIATALTPAFWGLAASAWAAAAGIAGAMVAAAPIILILTGIAAAAAALYYAWTTNFMGIQEIVSGLGETIATIIPPALKVMGDAWAAVAPYIEIAIRELRLFWTEISPKLATVLNFLAEVVGNRFRAMADFISGAMNIIVVIIDRYWNQISAILAAYLDIMMNIINIFWNIIAGFFKIGLSLLTGDWQGAWTALQDMLQNILGSMQNILGGFWEVTRNMFIIGWDAINLISGGRLDDLWKMFQSFGSSLGNAWDILWNTTLKGIVEGALNIIKGIMVSSLNFQIMLIESFINSIIDRANDITDILGGRYLPRMEFPRFVAAAQGFHGMVSQPTLFLAGERGAEAVNISPGGRGGGGTINIYIAGSLVSESGLIDTVRQELIRLSRRTISDGVLA